MKMDTQHLNPFRGFTVISFDVFDTLLVRSYLRPTDVFDRIEAESGAAGFSAARQKADHESVKLAQEAGRDANIDDAYALMPEAFRGLKDRELELEREGLSANAEMVEMWRQAEELGKRRVIASDMYLPRPFLESVLRENGIDGWDGFYLSCDCGVRKSSGKMYELILREQGVAPSRLLHVGDNAESDVSIPSRMGIHAFKVEKVVDRVMRENPFLARFLETDGSLESRRLVASVCVAWHAYAVRHPGFPYWARIGGLVGGVFGAAYVSFLVEKARTRKIDRVLFVARDGYVLERLFNLAAPEIKTNYVYAPRMIKESEDPKVHAEYARYVQALGIGAGESVAVVDSISWRFSAQKLIAESLGRDVYGLSFVALDMPKHGDCFIFSPRMTLRWCHLVEQFFTAREPPIQGISDGRPIHKTPMPSDEKKRLEAFGELMDAEIETATLLLRNQVGVSPVRLLDYIDAFLGSMTEQDDRQFALVRNGVDINSDTYEPLLQPPRRAKVWRKRKKIPIYRRHVKREGLKNVIRDYLFGFLHFRTIVDDL